MQRYRIHRAAYSTAREQVACMPLACSDRADILLGDGSDALNASPMQSRSTTSEDKHAQPDAYPDQQLRDQKLP